MQKQLAITLLGVVCIFSSLSLYDGVFLGESQKQSPGQSALLCSGLCKTGGTVRCFALSSPLQWRVNPTDIGLGKCCGDSPLFHYMQ